MTRIALFQSNTGVDPRANAAVLVEAIEKAAQGGAEMLFTPEMSGLLDRESARAASNVRSEEEDEVLAAVQDAACRVADGADVRVVHRPDDASAGALPAVRNPGGFV